jgi:hypothetical protein
MVVSPGSGYIFQGRTSTGGMGFYTLGGALRAAPNNWVRLVRSGTLVTAYTSGDGIAWTQVGSLTITMASSVEFGLAVTAHKAATLSTAVFDNVTAVP